MQELKPKTDEELVSQAQSGDLRAMDELLIRYNRIVRSRARRFFIAGGETDDLVQEGMMGLVAAIQGYKADAGKSFKNFAFMCISRRIYDAIGKMSAKKNAVLTESVPLFDPNVLDTLDDGSSPEEDLLNSEAFAELQMKLMRELSDFEYRVVSMYMDGLSYAQICELTKKPFKSVDNALARAKKKLQKAFEK